MARTLFTRESRITRLGCLGAVVLVLLTGQWLLLRFGDGLARWSYDIPFLLSRQSVPDELVMVYLDPKIKADLGQPTDQPLDRSFHAALLEKLTADGAKLVLFDILFDYPHADAAVNERLAAAMRKHGKVVLVGEYVEQWQGSVKTSSPLPPIEILRDAAAGWGLANVSTDADLEVRRLGAGTEDIASAGWVAASLLNTNSANISEARFKSRWINYYCAPTALSVVNFDHALQTNGLPAGFFRDKIVVVGSRGEAGVAGAGRDVFRTPFALRNEPMAPGAVIHAFSLLNLQQGDYLTRLSHRHESLLVIGWGLVVGLGLLRFKPWVALGVAFAAFCGFALVAVWLQSHEAVWFAWLVPAAAQTSVALLWSVTFQYTLESRRRQKLRRAFAAYMSPHLADRIAESDFDLALGGKEVEATVMFTDLEGFTAMSEDLSPAELSSVLTQYFSETTRSILDQQGTVIKYIGDAVLAVWGAPLVDPRPAHRAVLAALGMQRAGDKEIAGRRFRTRIGINSGLVLAGNLGSEFRFDYTVIGAAINAASRLEGLNKYLATDILISESTRQQLDDVFLTRCVGRFLLSGTKHPMTVHEVLGAAAEFNPRPDWLEPFDQALACFERGELDRSEQHFRKVIALRGGKDGPSTFYLEEIKAARNRPASAEIWNGVIRLASK